MSDLSLIDGKIPAIPAMIEEEEGMKGEGDEKVMHSFWSLSEGERRMVMRTNALLL